MVRDGFRRLKIGVAQMMQAVGDVAVASSSSTIAKRGKGLSMPMAAEGVAHMQVEVG